MVRAVLDSNQFIYSFLGRKPSCSAVIILAGAKFECIVSSTILREVLKIVREEKGKNYAGVVRYILANSPVELLGDSETPNSLIQKYKSKGLKPADSTIAAFTEHVRADYIVSENRHFIRGLETDAFKALRAREFLKELKVRDR